MMGMGEMGRAATNGNDEMDNDDHNNNNNNNNNNTNNNNNNNNSNNSNNNNSSGINIFNMFTCHLYIFSFQNFEWTLKNDCSSRSLSIFGSGFSSKDHLGTAVDGNQSLEYGA